MFCVNTRAFTVALSLLPPVIFLLLASCSDGQAFVISGGGGILDSSTSSSSSTFSWPFDESEEARLPRSCSNKHFQNLLIKACGENSKRSVQQPQVPPIMMNLLVVEYYFAPALSSSSVHPKPPNLQHQQPPPAPPPNDQQQPSSNHINGWIPPNLSKNGEVVDIPLVIQQRTTASVPFHITPESVMMKMEPWLAPWVLEHHHSNGHGAGVILIMEAPPSSGYLQHGLSSASLSLIEEEFGGLAWDLNEFREMLRRTPDKIAEVKRTYEMCCQEGSCEKHRLLHKFC